MGEEGGGGLNGENFLCWGLNVCCEGCMDDQKVIISGLSCLLREKEKGRGG